MPGPEYKKGVSKDVPGHGYADIGFLTTVRHSVGPCNIVVINDFA